MSAEIDKFPGITKLDISPALVLNGALQNGLTDVMVLGALPSGQFYIASSSADLTKMTFFVQCAVWEVQNKRESLEATSEGRDA